MQDETYVRFENLSERFTKIIKEQEIFRGILQKFVSCKQKIKTEENQRITSGLASVGVYTRGKFCWNLKVFLPVRAFVFPRPNAKPPQR